jgi:hypothetical protein
VIAGDPAGDPAELDVLETAGMSAVLLLPLVFEGTTIALLEIYRRAHRRGPTRRLTGRACSPTTSPPHSPGLSPGRAGHARRSRARRTAGNRADTAAGNAGEELP